MSNKVEPFRVVDNTKAWESRFSQEIGGRKVENGDSDSQRVRFYERSRFDTRERYIAQSILTGILSQSYLPTLEEARDIIAWAGRGVRQ